MMKLANKVARNLGVILFSFGILLGMALFGSATWGDLESTLFDAAIRGDASLSTLRCPVILSRAETGTVSAAFSNPLDRSIEFTIRTHISHGYLTLMREDIRRLPVDPGETETLEWTVVPDDAVYRHLILVNVHLFSHYPLPERRGTCGILVLDLPFLTGNQILTLAIAATVLSMGGGVGLWIANSRPLNQRARAVTRAMIASAATVMLGIVVSILGWWMLGALLFAATSLLVVEIIRHFMERSSS